MTKSVDVFESSRSYTSSYFAPVMCDIPKAALQILVFDTYQTAHFILHALRHSRISDVACNVYITKSENSPEMFILVKTGKCSVRLMKVVSW
jgi:hypothetical protein